MNAPERMTAVATATQTATSPLDPDFERLMARPFTQRELYEDQNFEKMMRMADHLAKGTLSIPKELKGNVGDCLAVVMQAMLWGLPPFAVAQCAHVINGKLGYEAKLVNAVVMNSGAIVGGFKYEYKGSGQGLQCRVGAVLRGESDITWNEWYGVADAAVKNSPLWKSNPAMQLGYVQVKFWVRAYAPGALLGIYTADELMDAEPMSMGGTSSPPPAQARPELPPYAADAFEKNFPGWQKLVTGEDGKTAQALLAKLSTKATFTEEQKARILALDKPAAPPADNEHADFVGAMDAAEGAAQ